MTDLKIVQCYFKPLLCRENSSGGGSGKVEGEGWHPWKRRNRPYSAEKLLIPLPVPHPAHIAVAIHNRDTDDIIPLDSELCQEILRYFRFLHGNEFLFILKQILHKMLCFTI